MGSPCSLPISDESRPQGAALVQADGVVQQACPPPSSLQTITDSEKKSGMNQEIAQSKFNQPVPQSKEQAPVSPSLSSTHSCVFIERDDDESISNETVPQDSKETTQSGVDQASAAEVIGGSGTDNNGDVRPVINPDEPLEGKVEPISVTGPVESKPDDTKMKGPEIQPENHNATDGAPGSHLNKEEDGKPEKKKPCLIRLFKGEDLDEKFVYTNQDMVQIVKKILEEEVDTFEIEEVQTATWRQPTFINDENENGETLDSAEMIHMTPLSEIFSIMEFFRSQSPENSENEAEHDEVFFRRDDSLAAEASQNEVDLSEVAEKGSMSGEKSHKTASGEMEDKNRIKTADEKHPLRFLDLRPSADAGLQATALDSAGLFAISSELDQLRNTPGAADKGEQIRKALENLLRSNGANLGARKASLSGLSDNRDGTDAAVLEGSPKVEPKNMLDQSTILAASEARHEIRCAV